MPFGPKNPEKLHLRIRLRIAQIIRLRAASVPDTRISQMLGVGRWTVNRIAGTREYKDAEASFVLGETSKLDELLGSKQEIMRTYFASSVPAAMRALVEMVQQKSDLKARLAASVELLDRDPKRSFVTARDAVSLSRPNADGTNAPTLPESMIEEIGRKATVLEQNALREALGPSGKPN